MILGPMIAVALASALALPATNVVASKAGAAQTPPPAASTNPLVSLAGAGFAAIGDLMHAVPILGPLATDIGVGAFCAAGFVPVIGDVTKASVSKFDKDQNQGNGCESSTSTSGSSGGFSFGGSSSAGSSSTGSSSAGSSTTGSSTAGGSTSGGATGTNVPDRTSGKDHTSDSDHTSDKDHTSDADHGRASTSTSSSGKHAGGTVAFPDRQFQLRRDNGGKQECLVKDAGSSVGYGHCDAAAAWTFQFSSGQLHPADDSATCLIASQKEFEAVTVGSCAGVTPWASHWYLSATHRLFVRDVDDHDDWRYLGARNALVTGGVSAREFPDLPVWTFAAA